MRELFHSRFGGRSWVAVREDGEVTELHADSGDVGGLVGAIFKSRVVRVLQGMQSAFLDLGTEKDAFLHVTDLLLPEELPPDIDPADDLGVEDEDDQLEHGPGGRWNNGVARRAPIQDRLKSGRDLLVQVARGSIRSKGPRVSCILTLPGRYLVYAPKLKVRGVSRRITDPDERDRLRKMMNDLPHEGGFIVRTAGAGRHTDAFEADASMLVSTWNEISARAERMKAPAMIYSEPGLLQRILRDEPRGYDRILLDDRQTYDRTREYLERLDPETASGIRIHAGSRSMFQEYGISLEIEKALRPRVWLKSGGYIVIEQTEALVSVDVNTGKFVGSRNLEETVLKTNLEAAVEIGRQLRLRDLGGIIVVDFIDMTKSESRRQVMDSLSASLEKDRARTKMIGLNELGLLQLTRKRTRPSLESLLTHSCFHCSGGGRVRTPEWTASEAILEIRRLLYELDEQKITVRTNPEVAHALMAALPAENLPGGEKGMERLSVEEDPTMRPDCFEVVAL